MAHALRSVPVCGVPFESERNVNNATIIKDALSAGEGVVRMAPCWVPRSFLMPGGRLKLDPRDLYALGAHRGGIDERWFSSTTKAANAPGTPNDEGLSYIAIDGKRVLLKEAIETSGDLFLGADVMAEHGGWNILCKFFDNLGPIPHHMTIADAAAYGVILTQGRGTLGKLAMETPSLIRFGEMTMDEVFVSAAAAAAGVKITNTSDKENLVMLKHFGPGNPAAAPLIKR